MCNINGHSIFTYLFQPWNASALYTSHARQKQVNEALAREAKAKEEANSKIKGDKIAKTVATAQINKRTNSQNLSTLRIPLETSKVGANTNTSSTVGLNLGG